MLKSVLSTICQEFSSNFKFLSTFKNKVLDEMVFLEILLEFDVYAASTINN
jgi:hypothetical protein